MESTNTTKQERKQLRSATSVEHAFAFVLIPGLDNQPENYTWR